PSTTALSVRPLRPGPAPWRGAAVCPPRRPDPDPRPARDTSPGRSTTAPPARAPALPAPARPGGRRRRLWRGTAAREAPRGRGSSRYSASGPPPSAGPPAGGLVAVNRLADKTVDEHGRRGPLVREGPARGGPRREIFEGLHWHGQILRQLVLGAG